MWKLFLEGDERPHGFISDETFDKMPWTDSFMIDYKLKRITVKGASTEAINRAFEDVVNAAITAKTFPVLQGRHSEMYPIVGARQPITTERFTATLFGIAARGAYMTAYVYGIDRKLKIWVARRGTVVTHPGMRDTTVAGGITDGHSPLKCIMEEAKVEASLPRKFVKKNVRSAGVITYVARAGKGVSPCMMFVYDLKLPIWRKPKPSNEEVAGFELMSVGQIMAAMFNGEFKANCTLVIIDFLIRHGFITPENEANYAKLVRALHRELPVPDSPDREG